MDLYQGLKGNLKARKASGTSLTEPRLFLALPVPLFPSGSTASRSNAVENGEVGSAKLGMH